MNFLICLIVLCTVYNAKSFGGSGSGGSGGIESFINSVFGIKTMAIGFKQNIVNQKFDKFKRGLSSFQQPTMPIATGQSRVYGAPPLKNMDSKIDDETAMYLPPHKPMDEIESEFENEVTSKRPAQKYTTPSTTTQSPEADKERKDAIKSIIGQIIGLKVQLITTAFPQILPAILGLGAKTGSSSSSGTASAFSTSVSTDNDDDDEFADKDGLEFSSDVA